MSELIEKYRAMVADKPDNGLLRFSLGKALFDAKDYPEAEEHLRMALSTRDDWMIVVMLLGECALARGDRDEARALYERGLELAVAQKHEDPETECRAKLAELAG
ncbi:MAG: tetratricopeptide repeat protein [Verrucomicrobiota bacterium]